MNIVFFGTSDFALPAFREILASRHKVLALVTQPDRKRGRRLQLSPPPTKVLAITKNIPVYQPPDVSDKGAIMDMKRLNPDLFVVVSFGQILDKDLLSVPKLYSINLHGSLLPEYRGAAPTNWAIINGDEKTGVTTIRMNERMDEGEIILKKEMRIDKDDTNITLSERLSELGAKALLDTIDLIDSKKATYTKQDDLKATYAPKLKKEDGLIDWDKEAVRIHNKVRGLLPWPGAYTHFNGKMLKILKSETLASHAGKDGVPGEVVDIVKGRGIIVKACMGFLAISYLQVEGKKILDADSFLRGHKIALGYKFG